MAQDPCVLHDRLEKDLDRIEKNQAARPCQDHTARLTVAEKTNEEQWTAINKLREAVWMWRGIMALAGFLGSIAGSLLISYVSKR